MNLRRTVGAVAATALATGATVLFLPTADAVTPPTPIRLALLGMSSSACPLPLNGSMAVTPGTTVQLQKDPVLGPLGTESVTITPAPGSAAVTSSKTYNLPAAGQNVAFAKAASYKLAWRSTTLGIVGTARTGKLIIDAASRSCVVVVQVPTPAVSIPGAGAITNPVNGVVGGVVGAVNGALGPVDSALGPILGSVPKTQPNPDAPSPKTATGSGLAYTPWKPTVADKTMPHSYGGGSGAASQYVASLNNAPGSQTTSGATGGAHGVAGSAQAPANVAPATSHTVDLAAKGHRSLLDALSAPLFVLAVIALSLATAFYARSFLLRRPQVPSVNVA